MIVRSETRYWIALIMATLLIQIAIVWTVIKYEPAVPVSAKPDDARASMTEHALPTTQADELAPADAHNRSVSVAPELPAAMEASASATIEIDALADSDLSFRAEAIIWESEKDYNLDSSIDPSEMETISDAGATPADDSVSNAVGLDTATVNLNSYQRAAFVLDAAVASGRWSRDDFIAILPDIQQLNEPQHEDLFQRFHAALRDRHLNAAAIADEGIPLPF